MNVPAPILIDLDQPRRGYRQFVSAWLVLRDDVRYVVDPGPASSAGHLVRSVRERTDRLDLILLTHIHIDHAGGTGDLVAAFPGVRVACVPRAKAHLVDPARLWEASRVVLGDVADMYGPITPVPEGVFASADDLGDRGITMIRTPGHAPHHAAFRDGDRLFVGEALGTRAPARTGVYRRTATPPRFDLDVALSSIDRLAALDGIRHLYFGHHGDEDVALGAIPAARRQLTLWTDLVRRVLADHGDDADVRAAQGRDDADGHDEVADASGRATSKVGVSPRWVRRCHDTLMETDPDYARIGELDDDIREREETFLANSLDGMRGYVETSRSGQS